MQCVCRSDARGRPFVGNNLVCGIIINQLYNQLIIIYLVKLVVVKSFHFHYSIIGFVKYPMMTGS